MRIERCLRNHGEEIRFVITNHEQGWEVSEERGTATVHDVVRDDWHRVECDLMLFDLRAAALRQQGWIENTSGDQQN